MTRELHGPVAITPVNSSSAIYSSSHLQTERLPLHPYGFIPLDQVLRTDRLLLEYPLLLLLLLTILLDLSTLRCKSIRDTTVSAICINHPSTVNFTPILEDFQAPEKKSAIPSVCKSQGITLLTSAEPSGGENKPNDQRQRKYIRERIAVDFRVPRRASARTRRSLFSRRARSSGTKTDDELGKGLRVLFLDSSPFSSAVQRRCILRSADPAFLPGNVPAGIKRPGLRRRPSFVPFFATSRCLSERSIPRTRDRRSAAFETERK